jgi:capsular exopolysaccharide synthesis family protein
MDVEDAAAPGNRAPGDEDAGARGRSRFLRVLVRFAPLILLIVIVAGGTAYFLSSSQTEKYEATSTLLFRQSNLADQLFGTGVNAVASDPTRQAATNVALISLDEVDLRVSERLGKFGLPATDVRDETTVRPKGDSDLVAVTVEDASPQRAALIANTFADEYIRFRQEADRRQVTQTIRLINRQLSSLTSSQASGTEGQRLRERRDQLQIVASLQTGNAEVVERATPPTEPSSPQPKRAALIAGGLALLVLIACGFVVERLDRRAKDEDEVIDAYGLPALGSVPQSRALAWTPGKSSRRSSKDLPPAEREAFQVLRSNISYFQVGRPLDSLLITSAEPGEGKSSVALHLAMAFAASGTRTVLVETDLRRPQVAARLNLPPGLGLSGLLLTDSPPDEGIDQIRVGPDEERALDVIHAGPVPPNPAELLESERMSLLLESLRSSHDMVVIDGPPALLLSDLVPIMPRVSGILLVARVGRTNVDSARALRARLRLLNVRALGVVINGIKPQSSAYAYADQHKT